MKLEAFILAVLFSVLPLVASAQEQPNMKFGKPTQEELQMTAYAAEPDAEAVVLCRLTDVTYTVQTISYLVDYHEKVRLKVLKPDGARFAKVAVHYQKNMTVGNNIMGLRSSFMTIPMDAKSGSSAFLEQDGSMSDGVFGTDGDESVEGIKATAFNLEGGKVKKTSLKKSDIKTTKLDDQNYVVEFTVPDVRVGTVIEYEYKIHSQLFWQLRDWYAQCEIPVVYAKLDMNIPNYLIFNIEDHGIQRLTYTCTVGTLQYKVESDPLTNPMYVNTNHYVYEGRDLKGLAKDDYVWNLQDYCAGITAELKEYRLRGMNQMDFAKTWEQVDEMILGSDDLGNHLNDHSPLADELKEAGAIADLRERVAAVFRLVTSRVKWNGKYELSPAPTAETLQKGEGSNADINLLLIQSLHDAGLTAAPVVLRTRDLGQLPYNFPSLLKLSTFIVGVVMPSGGNIYLDASGKDGWLNTLPEVLLVEKARLVLKNRQSQWVNLQKVSKRETSTVVDARLSADGTLSGTQTTLYRGLSALHYRQQGGHSGDFSPEVKAEEPFSSRGDVSDDAISILPLGTLPLAGNPFTADSRPMPVEFPSLSAEKVVVNITLPEGYTLAETPQPTVASTPDKGVSGRYAVSQTGQKVQVVYQFNVSKVMHPQQSYDSLRGIYDLFSKCCRQPLVVKKK